MKKLLCGLAASMALAASANAATVVFSENFDDEATSFGFVLNFTNFSNFTVTGGSVDLIPNGAAFILCAGGSGGCIDLDGTTPGQNPASTILSSSIALQAGTKYTLSFDYSGNQRGFPSDSFRVFLGTVLDETIADVVASAAFTTHSISFVAAVDAVVQLGFSGLGPSDNVGVILDNISLVADPVPVPAALPLFLGALGAGAWIRRRKSAAN